MWTVVIILLILWALGMLSASTFGGLLHVLLIVAVVVVVLNLVRGRRGL